MHRNPRDVGKISKLGVTHQHRWSGWDLASSILGYPKGLDPQTTKRCTANRWCLPRNQWWSVFNTSYIVQYFFSFQFISFIQLDLFHLQKAPDDGRESVWRSWGELFEAIITWTSLGCQGSKSKHTTLSSKMRIQKHVWPIFSTSVKSWFINTQKL